MGQHKATCQNKNLKRSKFENKSNETGKSEDTLLYRKQRNLVTTVNKLTSEKTYQKRKRLKSSGTIANLIEN